MKKLVGQVTVEEKNDSFIVKFDEVENAYQYEFRLYKNTESALVAKVVVDAKEANGVFDVKNLNNGKKLIAGNYYVSVKAIAESESNFVSSNVSEKVFFDHESTGCSSDLGTVTAIAKRMVTRYGMSGLGKMAIDEKNGFMQEKIYDEMKKIVDEAYEKTYNIVLENKDMIHYIANELKVRETLEGGEIEELMENIEENSTNFLLLPTRDSGFPVPCPDGYSPRYPNRYFGYSPTGASFPKPSKSH